LALSTPQRASTANCRASMVPMGEVRKSGLPPQASEPNPRLEAALEKLLQGIRQSRGG
jgi:hypothetical protein